MQLLKLGRNQWLCLAGGAVSVFLWKNRRWFRINDVTSGRTIAYPNLKPRCYTSPPSDVFALAEATAREMPRWRVISVDRTGRELQTEAEMAVFRLVDDVTIRVDWIPESNESEVVVRSHSRVGRGDLGENARRIAAFYHRLDERVAHAAVKSDENSE